MIKDMGINGIKWSIQLHEMFLQHDIFLWYNFVSLFLKERKCGRCNLCDVNNTWYCPDRKWMLRQKNMGIRRQQQRGVLYRKCQTEGKLLCGIHQGSYRPSYFYCGGVTENVSILMKSTCWQSWETLPIQTWVGLVYRRSCMPLRTNENIIKFDNTNDMQKLITKMSSIDYEISIWKERLVNHKESRGCVKRET